MKLIDFLTKFKEKQNSFHILDEIYLSCDENEKNIIAEILSSYFFKQFKKELTAIAASNVKVYADLRVQAEKTIFYTAELYYYNGYDNKIFAYLDEVLSCKSIYISDKLKQSAENILKTKKISAIIKDTVEEVKKKEAFRISSAMTTDCITDETMYD